jgi:hypothetical protein
MKVPIYRISYKEAPDKEAPGDFIFFSLEPYNQNGRMIFESEGKKHEYTADTSLIGEAAGPEGATLERDRTGRLVLAWDLHGERIQSDAGEIFIYAERGLYGFQWVSKPT